jgi:hypothetical protein
MEENGGGDRRRKVQPIHAEHGRCISNLSVKMILCSYGYTATPSGISYSRDFSHRFPPCRVLPRHTSFLHYTRHVSASLFLSPRSIIPSSYLEICPATIAVVVFPVGYRSYYLVGQRRPQRCRVRLLSGDLACMGGGRRCRKSLVENLTRLF